MASHSKQHTMHCECEPRGVKTRAAPAHLPNLPIFPSSHLVPEYHLTPSPQGGRRAGQFSE
jgi:hypothetical protein